MIPLSRPCLAGLLAGLFLPLISPAADRPPHPPRVMAGTEVRQIPQASNGRAYELYVALPGSYAQHPERRYPVLYLCDGYWDFNLVSGFMGNLVYDEAAPEIIVVGIGYPGPGANYDALRAYDYTPVPDPEDAKAERTGHARAFLQVIEQDIIPLIERDYRADPTWRVLGGSSLGGLFSLYAMYERPGLFQGHIAPSPATVWANDWLAGVEEKFAASGRALPTRLYMTGAAEEWPEFLAGIVRFHERLRTRQYPEFVYGWRLIDGERHAGTKAESFNRGVRFTFAPRAPKP